MNHENDSQPMADYAIGGLVDETFPAAERNGGYRMRADGSESNEPPVLTIGAGTVNYYFPVEIEVVGGLTEHQRASLEAGIWSQLTDAFERGA